MVRRRPVDFVGWRLYKRAMLVPVLALLLLLVTSFRAEIPVQSTLPPTLANEQAATLLAESGEFATRFADRRPGTPGAVDSAQFMLDGFTALGLDASTVPATSTDPATGKSVGLVNVEAVLPGRTRELVVVHAHRDTATADGRGADAIGQVALLAIAREMAASRDRRRTYMFVSTDGATLNGGGARALAHRLTRRGEVIAVIGIDRVGAGGTLRVDGAPSAQHRSPLGLVQAATRAVEAEVGPGDHPALASQLNRLAAPITLREHGQMLHQGLPALTITAGDDQLATNGDANAAAPAVGAGLRSVQRLLGTLEQVDQLQSAGRTWISTERRVYRGWALKILIASLLIPVWVCAVDMLLRHRAGWNFAAAIGTCARAMLAGMFAIASLWMLGAVGLLPGSGDRPPNPGSLDDVRVFALIIWTALVVGAWLLARGPDWRRQRRAAMRSSAAPDTPELVVSLVGLVVVSVLTLAINPYTVLFAIPSLHIWICMASWRIVFTRRLSIIVWSAGLIGPLLALIAIGARADSGMGTLWFAVQLVQTRTVPPLLALLVGAGGGLVVMLLIAALGRVAFPALPRLRAAWLALHDGEVGVLEALLPARVREGARSVVRSAVKLRVPTPTAAPSRSSRRTSSRSQGRVRASSSRSTMASRDAGSSYEDARLERARQRAEARNANRSRVKSR